VSQIRLTLAGVCKRIDGMCDTHGAVELDDERATALIDDIIEDRAPAWQALADGPCTCDTSAQCPTHCGAHLTSAG